ncbi:MAG: hypothetical protein JNM02_08790 [Anaerolineales bacterium]|nr:hypothetical protein [Anaerolineales bacterium]
MSKKWLIWLFPVLFAAVYFGVNKIWPIVGIDWKETYYPAARALLEGKNPYLVPTFRNPPWTILFLIPFALFSETIGGILFFMASLILYAWSAYRLKASLVALIVFMLAPPVVYGMRMLNVDVFVLIGFTLPAPAALFFVIIKPQMGLAMVPFLLFKAFKEGGIKQVLVTCVPVSIAAAFSFLFFGDWFSGRQADLLDSFWNAGLWPWAIPIGVVLMALSLRDLRADFSMAASPFLSPYLAYHSWAAVLAGLIKYDFEFVVAVLAMWLVAVIKSFGLA